MVCEVTESIIFMSKGECEWIEVPLKSWAEFKAMGVELNHTMCVKCNWRVSSCQYSICICIKMQGCNSILLYNTNHSNHQSKKFLFLHQSKIKLFMKITGEKYYQTMTFKLFIVLSALHISSSYSGPLETVYSSLLFVGKCESHLFLTRCSNSKQKKSDSWFQVIVTFVRHLSTCPCYPL